MEIKIKSTPGNMITRFQCTVCGGSTDKTNVHLTFNDPADGREEFVCESCVARGPQLMKETLLRHADRMALFAEELRRLAEADFIVPTSEEIDRANYEHDRACGYVVEPFADYVAERSFEKWKQQFLSRDNDSPGA